MATINVHNPGFQSTIQDLGRPGFAHLGVSASGAADPVSLRIGNLLVENPENSPALEMTLIGGTFEFDSDAVVSITGSDFGPTINGAAVPLWTSLFIKGGDRLEFGSTRSGARCYLCIRGDIKCQPVLGSASTHLLTGIGGIDGRALKKGDILSAAFVPGKTSFVPKHLSGEPVALLEQKRELRITVGPQSEYFSTEALSTLLSSRYLVSEDSNRMGLRLIGPALARTTTKEMLTEGVSLGAIQVPQSGQPIILFVEHQTTGGYPKIANVVSADFHRLGQLRPRDEVQFEQVSFQQAEELLKQQEMFINPLSFATV